MSIAQLFSAEQAERRHTILPGRPKSPRRRKTLPRRQKVLFEALEPRLLLSVDPALLPSAGLDPNTSPEEPVLVMERDVAPQSSTTTTGAEVPLFVPGEIVFTDSGEVDPAEASLADVLTTVTAFRADPRFAGIDGDDMTAVIVDTGIDVDHPFFGPDSNTDGVADRIVYQYDFADDDPDASDRTGHGSLVSSIIGSEDETYPGIAPEANLIALKVFEDEGPGFFSYLEEALQWVVENAATYDIGVVNMSLGDGRNWDFAASHYGIGDELAALADLDVLTVSASGNGFYKFDSVQGVAYPAADPHSLAVGAVWSGDFGGPWQFSSGAVDHTTAADWIVSFSQRHAELTDVFAPGARFTGAGSTGGTLTMQGTSQASAYLTGTTVLAQQLAVQELGRRLTGDEFADLLATTGDVINDGDDEQDNVRNTGLDFPRVNLLAMAESILTLAGADSVTPEARISLDVDGNGIADALTDQVLIVRHLFGFRGDVLIEGVVDPLGTRTTAAEIEAFLSQAKSTMLDVDENGVADALTDGMLIARFLFGFTGQALIEGAVDPGGNRTSAAEIEAFLQGFMPMAEASSLSASIPVTEVTQSVAQTERAEEIGESTPANGQPLAPPFMVQNGTNGVHPSALAGIPAKGLNGPWHMSGGRNGVPRQVINGHKERVLGLNQDSAGAAASVLKRDAAGGRLIDWETDRQAAYVGQDQRELKRVHSSSPWLRQFLLEGVADDAMIPNGDIQVVIPAGGDEKDWFITEALEG